MYGKQDVNSKSIEEGQQKQEVATEATKEVEQLYSLDEARVAHDGLKTGLAGLEETLKTVEGQSLSVSPAERQTFFDSFLGAHAKELAGLNTAEGYAESAESFLVTSGFTAEALASSELPEEVSKVRLYKEFLDAANRGDEGILLDAIDHQRLLPEIMNGASAEEQKEILAKLPEEVVETIPTEGGVEATPPAELNADMITVALAEALEKNDVKGLKATLAASALASIKFGFLLELLEKKQYKLVDEYLEKFKVESEEELLTIKQAFEHANVESKAFKSLKQNIPVPATFGTQERNLGLDDTNKKIKKAAAWTAAKVAQIGLAIGRAVAWTGRMVLKGGTFALKALGRGN